MRAVAFLGAAAAAAVAVVTASRSDLPGWGKEGHEITATIAQGLIGKAATEAADILLWEDLGSLSAVAAWADSVRDLPEYAWSAPLHFINSPDWACDSVRSRDCYDPNGDFMYCVDGAIANYTERLTDQSLSLDQLTEALKFEVHFIGDIHQPLHCGFIGDAGGNDYQGTFEGTSTNLHAIWDTLMIVKRVNSDFLGLQSLYADWLLSQVQTTWASQAASWIQCNTTTPYGACSQQWGNESVGLACEYAYVYADGKTPIGDGFDLEDDYYQRNYPIVDMQLAKAGVRMAYVLDSLWPSNQTALAASV